MKENPSEREKSNAVTVKLSHPPEFIMRCPRCGGEVGLWSENQETTCTFCDLRLFERETTEH